MKYFILLITFIISSAFGATCTSTSRTNYTTNQVLTSTALNADFNQLVTKLNAFDGGCVTDGTLEFSALGSDFSTLTNGIQQGCKVSYSDAATVSIGKCIATVNGYSIRTTAANTVTWGCSGCSAEVASTTYYVYIKTGSSGTTLNLLISTSAPNEDGYDGSNNKVIGRFYNNSSSDIDQYSIDQWMVNRFDASNTGYAAWTPTLSAGFGTTSNLSAKWRRNGDSLEASIAFTLGTVAASVGTITLPTGLIVDSTKTAALSSIQVVGHWQTNGANTLGTLLSDTATSTSTVRVGGPYNSANMFGAINISSVIASSANFQTTFKVPIAGWNN